MSAIEQQLDIRLTADGVSVDQDLPCCQCDYNLRMQPRAGVCPECGTAIETTIAKRTLVLINPKWLKGITFGARILSYGIPTVLIAVVVVNLLVNQFIPNLDVWFLLGGIIGLALVGLAGICCFARPLRTELASSVLRLTGIIARVASLLFAIVIIAAIVNPFIPSSGNIVFMAFTIILLFITALVSFALYCCEIASLLDDAKSRSRCITYAGFFGVGWVLTIPWFRVTLVNVTTPSLIVLGTLFVGIGVIIIFGLLILVLPNHLTKKLRQARDEAQAMIETNKPAPVQSSAATV